MHQTWDPVELELRATERYDRPVVNVSVTARFEHESGDAYEVPAFWDRERTWRVRFAPPEPGEWTWETTAAVDDDGLARRGAFGVTAAAGAGRLREHGFLVADGRELRHADGEPFFWLGDTAWSAGAKASPDEWATFLDYRAAQGFTAVQINALPQHDASLPQNRVPFVDWDLDRPDPDYFRALDAGVAACHDRGIVPALVALWYDYVAGENPDWTVASGRRRPFDAEEARRFGRYLGARYGAYGAVWILSGDAEFADGTVPIYDALATAVRDAVPVPLCTVHTPGTWVTPERINDREWLDFHLYQSGHLSDLDIPAEQATAFRELEPERPVINGEPPYEGHGFFDDDRAERITREHARRAAWISLLAGANAGVTYGGQGLWQWHRLGEENGQSATKGRPDAWDDALTLPGARDYARIRTFLSGFDYGALEPRQDLLESDDDAVRAAEVPDGAETVVLAYTPHAEGIAFASGTLDGREVVWRHPATGETVPADVDGDAVAPAPFLDDGLLVVR